MKPATMRILGLALVALSTLGLIISVPAMATRLAKRAEEGPRAYWYVDRIYDQLFTFADREVEIENVSAQQGPMVRIRWSDDVQTIPVSGVEDERLPELLRHNDWLHAIQMVRVEGGEHPDELIAEGRGAYKLVIVARSVEPGFDPGAKGAWRYIFLELESGEDRIRRSQSTFKALEPATWQYAAAMQVTPKQALQPTAGAPRPPRAPEGEGGFEPLGWTWTVAGFSLFFLMVGGTLFAASFVSSAGLERLFSKRRARASHA